MSQFSSLSFRSRKLISGNCCHRGFTYIFHFPYFNLIRRLLLFFRSRASNARAQISVSTPSINVNSWILRRNNFALLNRLPKYGGRDNARNVRCGSVIRYLTSDHHGSITNLKPANPAPTLNLQNELIFTQRRQPVALSLVTAIIQRPWSKVGDYGLSVSRKNYPRLRKEWPVTCQTLVPEGGR